MTRHEWTDRFARMAGAGGPGKRAACEQRLENFAWWVVHALYGDGPDAHDLWRLADGHFRAAMPDILSEIEKAKKASP